MTSDRNRSGQCSQDQARHRRVAHAVSCCSRESPGGILTGVAGDAFSHRFDRHTVGLGSLRFYHLQYWRPGGRAGRRRRAIGSGSGSEPDLPRGQEEDRAVQSRLPDRRRPGRGCCGRLRLRTGPVRQSGVAHRAGDDPLARRAALLRSGPPPRLCVQPRRGRARVPQGAGDRSDLRHVLLGRGLCAGPEHQHADDARGGGTGLRGDRPRHGAARMAPASASGR